MCYHEYETIPKSCKNDKCTFNVCKTCIGILPTRHSIIEPTRGNTINYKDCPACKTPIEQLSRSNRLEQTSFDEHGHCPDNFVCCCLLGHCSVSEWQFLQRCTPSTATCCCLGLDCKFENNNHPAVSRFEIGICDGPQVCGYTQRNFLEQSVSFGTFIFLTIGAMCCIKCTGNVLLHLFANHHLATTAHDCFEGYHNGSMCIDCCVGFWSICSCASCIRMTQQTCFNDVVGAHGPCCGAFITCICDHPRAVISHEAMERS